MQVTELISIIEQTAIPALAAPWDKSGIQVAAGRENVSHMAVMLDPTLKNIKLALEKGADFILAHHPLSLQARFPDTPGSYHSTLSLLFKQDVCLYSAHTSLDANPRGPVSWLAESFNLIDYTVLETTVALPGKTNETAGFGFVGNLPNILSYEEFCAKLSLVLEISAWRSCGQAPKIIRSMACCPGSGASIIEDAIKAGADIYITGDIKYHDALDAEICVLDTGHFKLEEKMMYFFAEHLAERIPEIKITFLPGNDPFVFTQY
jgi:dinuclear metal center YbgI/SA1388 family protein